MYEENFYVKKSFELIEFAIKDSLSKKSEMYFALPLKSWNKEHANIKISLPRMCGNTFLLRKILNNYENSILLFQKEEQIVYLNKCNLEQNYPKIDKNRCFSINKLENIRSICLEDKIILLDWSSFTSKQKMDEIFSLNALFFILLG